MLKRLLALAGAIAILTTLWKERPALKRYFTMERM